MNTSGLFMLADEATLIREIQRRIDQRSHWLIPVHDPASVMLAGAIYERWYSTGEGSKLFQVAVIPDVLPNSASFTLAMGERSVVTAAMISAVFIDSGKTIDGVWLRLGKLPPAVEFYMESHFRWHRDWSN